MTGAPRCSRPTASAGTSSSRRSCSAPWCWRRMPCRSAACGAISITWASRGWSNGSYWLAFWTKVLQPLVTAALVLMAISFIFGPLRSATLGQRVFTGVLVGFVVPHRPGTCWGRPAWCSAFRRCWPWWCRRGSVPWPASTAAPRCLINSCANASCRAFARPFLLHEPHRSPDAIREAGSTAPGLPPGDFGAALAHGFTAGPAFCRRCWLWALT